MLSVNHLTGFGNIGGFNPARVPGCVLWLDAWGFGNLNDGDAISTWTDRSGRGNNATSTSTQRPTFKTNIVNGKPIARFDGVDDRFVLPSFASLTAGEIFLVIKCRLDPNVDGKTGIWSMNANSGVSLSHFPFTDGNIYESWGSTVRKTVGNPTPSLASWRVYNVFSASNDYGVNLDNSSLFTTATNTVGFSATEYIGVSTGVPGTQWLDGDVAAVAMYDNKLASDDRTLVYNYFKYDLAL